MHVYFEISLSAKLQMLITTLIEDLDPNHRGRIALFSKIKTYLPNTYIITRGRSVYTFFFIALKQSHTNYKLDLYYLKANTRNFYFAFFEFQ